MGEIILYGILYKALFILFVISSVNFIYFTLKIFLSLKNQGKYTDVFGAKYDYLLYVLSIGYIVMCLFTGIGVI